MDIFRYIVRFLYKIRWYLVVLPLIAFVVAFMSTRNLERVYNVETTIYTGMITGYNIEGTAGTFGGNSQTNINNLLKIISTNNTIHEVSLRLFARCMMRGNLQKDNNFISAEHFKALNATVPQQIKNKIDYTNEETTYQRLVDYEKATQNNYIYGILQHHEYFGIDQITSRLKPIQLDGTDIINISYSANDPGICYNTIDILNRVFAKQYQRLRLGETTNVIKFFEKEVKKLKKALEDAEENLIRYNVKYGIINYGEQTKQLTVLDAEQQNARNTIDRDLTTSQALLDYLERQMGNRAAILRSNQEFTNLFRDISRLQSRISNLKLMGSENGGNDAEAQQELAKAEREMATAMTRVKQLTGEIEANTYVPNTSVKASDLSERWLDQMILLERTKAELTVQDLMKQKLEQQFKFYSPIGAVLDRKIRRINFIEGNFMEMQKSLNTARLRQKNLLTTTATLRVLNPPVFPVGAQATNRPMILLGALLLTFVLTALYFFVIEMLDRTLRDRMRSERITKIPVLGCYPRESSLRYRRFNKTISDMALRQLSKALLPHFQEGQQNILNLLSTDAANGKSYIAQELENYWVSIGLRVRRITYDEDFLAEDSRYIMAKDVKDLCPDIMPDEIAIIEYPNLDDNSISSALLNMGTINLMVTRANRTWKDVDQKALKELQSRLKDQNTLFMYLTEASRYAVEEFVGQLPPYTKFNNFIYRISQMGLTAIENNHAK